MATQKREIVFTPPSGTGELLFRRMQAREELGRLPEYTVELLRLSKDAKVIRASSLLGKVATVSMMLDDDSLRHFNGHIVRFVQGATRGRFDVFHAELRPWLWFLTRTPNQSSIAAIDLADKSTDSRCIRPFPLIHNFPSR